MSISCTLSPVLRWNLSFYTDSCSVQLAVSPRRAPCCLCAMAFSLKSCFDSVFVCLFLFVCVSLSKSLQLLSPKLPYSLCFIKFSLLDRLLSTSLLCFPKLLSCPHKVCTRSWPVICHVTQQKHPSRKKMVKL